MTRRPAFLAASSSVRRMAEKFGTDSISSVILCGFGVDLGAVFAVNLKAVVFLWVVAGGDDDPRAQLKMPHGEGKLGQPEAPGKGAL